MICLLFGLSIGMVSCSTLENRRELYYGQNRGGEYTRMLEALDNEKTIRDGRSNRKGWQSKP